MGEFQERQCVGLSTENRQLLAKIEASIGRTSDERQGDEYDRVIPDYARGYLNGLVSQTSDDNILMLFYLVRLILK